MSNNPIHFTKKEIADGLKNGHEYEWSFGGKEYYLLPTWSNPPIVFQIKGGPSKLYNDIDEIIADGFDLISMMDGNSELYEY